MWLVGRVVRMTNKSEYSQGRKSRPLDVNRGVRERNGLNHLTLGLGRKRAVAIRGKRGKEIVDSRRFATANQMKEDSVGRRRVQMALSGSPRNRVKSGMQRVIWEMTRLRPLRKRESSLAAIDPNLARRRVGREPRRVFRGCSAQK